MTAAELAVENVTLTAGAYRLVREVSLTARPGEVVGLVGPNGSGKSSLLRAVYRVLRPDSGRVRVDGADAWSLPVRRLARTLASVVQEPGADFDLTVREVVAMGRTPTSGCSTATPRRTRASSTRLSRRWTPPS